jgi:predicted unusual protein kinase regulating ubiquinone biosynthesis (AarF/ABC1/UbiB family)
MKLSLKPPHLRRYKDILRLFWRYGRADVARELEGLEGWGEAHDEGANPEQLAEDLERMGPTFVKLGQLLSSRADLFPPRHLDALARLQDDVQPFPFDEVEKIVGAELNVRLSKAFSSFERAPLAAASLGQVHAAALRDGRPVVVKVQRPGIRTQVVEDFEVLTGLASFLDEHTTVGKRYRFGRIVDELRSSILLELDYEREASNLVRLSDNMRGFERIHVPLPVDDYTTRSILTMDYVRGTKITQLNPLRRIDIDGEALADELFRAYLKQILVDGLFHADPHPGNVFLTDDGRIALLDLGMVGRTTGATQDQLLKLTLALSEAKADVAVDVSIQLGERTDSFDEPEFRRRATLFLAEQGDATLEAMNLGRTMLGMSRVSAETGLYAPSHLTLLGKTLLQLDHIGRTLAPTFDPNAAVRRQVSQILTQRMWDGISPANLLAPALELKEFVFGLPSRLNRILDAIAKAELELKVKTPDAEAFLKAFQKMANRVTMGLILAAMIVGASLLMHVETRFRLFGYPGIAMLFFLAAAGGGAWLVLDMAIQDRRDRRRMRS